MIFTDDLEILKKECLENGEELKKEPGVIISNTPFVVLHNSAWRSGRDTKDAYGLVIMYPCYQPHGKTNEEGDWFSFSSKEGAGEIMLLQQMGFSYGAYKWTRYEDHRELFENDFGINL